MPENHRFLSGPAHTWLGSSIVFAAQNGAVRVWWDRRDAPAADNRLAMEAQIRSLLSNPLRLGMQSSLTLYWHPAEPAPTIT